MKSFITLLLAGSVLFVSGQFFGWWNAPIPGAEMIPSYQDRKYARDAKEQAERERLGLAGDADYKGASDENAKRRSAALKNGGGLDESNAGR